MHGVCMSKISESHIMKAGFSLVLPLALLLTGSPVSAQEVSPPPSLQAPAETPQEQPAPPAAAAPATDTVPPPPASSVAPPAATLPPPVAETPSSNAVPPLGDVLDQQGAVPTALPPGFNLPLEENLGSEQSKEEKEAELRQKAFDAAVNGMYALKPNEIRKMLEIDDETKQAAQTPLFPSPTPETVFETISLDPGSKPLTIKTAMGNVTTLSMVDASGQPWPIKDISWAGNFEIQQPEQGSNILRITPMSEFASGNVSMRMVGLNPPVILVFRADRQTVHVRIDVQVPEMGPNGIAPLINTSATSTVAGNGSLSAILEGVPPVKAKKLTLSGVDGRTSAYNLGGVMYLGTPYTLVSPAWNSSVRSADGTNVYSLSSTPVILLSDKGKMVRAYLSGEEQANGK